MGTLDFAKKLWMLEENPELQKKISLFKSGKRRYKYLFINEKFI